MRWIKRILMVALALPVLGVALMFLTGRGDIVRLVWDFNFAGPDQPFDPADAVPPPDYALAQNWGALPDRDDLGDVYPPGVELEARSVTRSTEAYRIKLIRLIWVSRPLDNR